jgi:hypothetical protein
MVLVYKNWRVMVIRCKDIVAKGQFVLRLNWNNFLGKKIEIQTIYIFYSYFFTYKMIQKNLPGPLCDVSVVKVAPTSNEEKKNFWYLL